VLDFGFHCFQNDHMVQLDKDTKAKLKLFKRAKKAERKLKRLGSSASKQQRDSLKRTLAKAYRAFPTDHEKKLTKPLLSLGFESQYQILGYIADFANFQHKLIVEVDGAIHETRKGYDAHRTEVLNSAGWRVMRFSNAMVGSNLSEVLRQIKEVIQPPIPSGCFRW
jgi:very-short-patch-repair endonuclease